MVSVPGVYKDGVVTLLEPIPNIRSANVIVTVMENHPSERETAPGSVANGGWLGAMQGTAQIVGDIVQPIEDSFDDWQALNA